MQVRIVSFARVREILGDGSALYEFHDGTTIGAIWDALAQAYPALAPLGASTRFARNGALARRDLALSDGDELALLPPIGGG